METKLYYLFLPNGEVFFNKGSAAGLHEKGCFNAVLRTELRGSVIWYLWIDDKDPRLNMSPWHLIPRDSRVELLEECEMKYLLLKDLYEN